MEGPITLTKNQLHYQKYKQTFLDYQKKNRERYNQHSRESSQRKRDRLKAEKEKEIAENYLRKIGLNIVKSQ